jgi:hypothetical protein
MVTMVAMAAVITITLQLRHLIHQCVITVLFHPISGLALANHSRKECENQVNQ